MNYMSDTSAGKKGSVLNFLVTIALAILGFVYLSLTVYTQDALWFYPVFDSQPALGIIHCYGEEIVLQAGSEHLSNIANLVNEQISGDKRWDELNLSDQIYTTYQTSDIMMSLELTYAEPQRIHSFSPFFSNFDTLIIPLDGSHANTNTLFNLVRGKPAGGSFHVQSFVAVLNYLEDNNLCKQQ